MVATTEQGPAEAAADDLPPGQAAAYAAVLAHMAETGQRPTVRELGERLGIKSPNGVMCHLNALRKKGLLEPGDDLHRSRTVGVAAVTAAVRRVAREMLGRGEG